MCLGAHIHKKVSEYDQKKYHNHNLQINPWHREEELQDNYSNKTFLVEKGSAGKTYLLSHVLTAMLQTLSISLHVFIRS